MSRHGKMALVLSLAAAAAATTCTDPLGGSTGIEVASISALQIPYPTVVVGDLMRDSLGVPAPLSLLAYDSEGRVLLGQPVFINVLDATANTLGGSIRITSLGYVQGIILDSIGARVFAGAGALEAPMQRIFVSVAPQVATKSTEATAITFDSGTPDTSTQTNWSPPLELTLTDASLVGAQGFVITYEVTRSPTPTTAGVATAYVGDDAGKASRRDTTDARGIASRRVILRQQAIEDVLRSGTKTDTIIVHVTVKYNGAELSGTPFDYIVPVTRKP